MFKVIDRIPLQRLEQFHEHTTTSTPVKRIKISNQRLPSDFFMNRDSQRKLISSTSIVRQQSKTHHDLRPSNRRLLLSIPQREMSTALERKKDNDNDQQLINGVISTARQMNKMIRKHSIQLKKGALYKNQQMTIELPPITLRKGLNYF